MTESHFWITVWERKDNVRCEKPLTRYMATTVPHIGEFVFFRAVDKRKMMVADVSWDIYGDGHYAVDIDVWDYATEMDFNAEES